MRLLPDTPQGKPPFELSQDEIATVVDLLCRGAVESRNHVTAGMHEVPITLHLKKVLRRLKKELGLTNLEIHGEFELLDLTHDDPAVLGRIDIILKFLHQFGYEDAYLGVECKRVADGDSDLSQRYVSEGVARFATGKYAQGHLWGIMLGYVVKLPAAALVADIDLRIRKAYGDDAKFTPLPPHAAALALHGSALPQGSHGHVIRLVHVFVDMTPPLTSSLATS